jgi:hypothetical protein
LPHRARVPDQPGVIGPAVRHGRDHLAPQIVITGGFVGEAAAIGQHHDEAGLVAVDEVGPDPGEILDPGSFDTGIHAAALAAFDWNRAPTASAMFAASPVLPVGSGATSGCVFTGAGCSAARRFGSRA